MDFTETVKGRYKMDSGLVIRYSKKPENEFHDEHMEFYCLDDAFSLSAKGEDVFIGEDGLRLLILIQENLTQWISRAELINLPSGLRRIITEKNPKHFKILPTV